MIKLYKNIESSYKKYLKHLTVLFNAHENQKRRLKKNHVFSLMKTACLFLKSRIYKAYKFSGQI